ncbi:glycosyltransferase family 2 protein [Sanguibacter gelidistatuariae]|uniref:glycosyltransferase family 2 protein n=1 Tax=Sanguibacter gelidistatuariae TaxID=1814289 RepID=UPI001587FE5A|nr:glycosyltransferase family 2 protein [Sanguibacter gelidistatuariae]
MKTPPEPTADLRRGLTALSVVIPVYNEEAWIRRSVAAVLAAGETAGIDLDIVVVDDGSTDSTAQVIDELAIDPRVRRVSQTNAGRMAARVTGAQTAIRSHLLLLDARVIVGTDSLRWMADSWDTYPDASVWCGHVDIETRGNPVAAFWSGLTKVGWRRYMSNPRVVSFGADDFDQFPKGTTALLLERDYFLELAGAFESLFDQQRLSSDDTRLLRQAAGERRIWLSPQFSFDYHGKTGVGGLRKQAYFRGTTFVDSYLGQSRVLGPALVGASVGGVALIAFTVAKPSVGIPCLLAAWAAIPVAVSASGGTRREVGAAAAMTPAFAILFGSGVLRGYALAARAKFRSRRDATS